MASWDEKLFDPPAPSTNRLQNYSRNIPAVQEARPVLEARPKPGIRPPPNAALPKETQPAARPHDITEAVCSKAPEDVPNGAIEELEPPHPPREAEMSHSSTKDAVSQSIHSSVALKSPDEETDRFEVMTDILQANVKLVSASPTEDFSPSLSISTGLIGVEETGSEGTTATGVTSDSPHGALCEPIYSGERPEEVTAVDQLINLQCDKPVITTDLAPEGRGGGSPAHSSCTESKSRRRLSSDAKSYTLLLPLNAPLLNENVILMPSSDIQLDSIASGIDYIPLETLQEVEVMAVDREEASAEHPVKQKRKRSNNQHQATPTKIMTRNSTKTKAASVKATKDAGGAHTSLAGKVHAARKMGPGCSIKCRMSCRSNVSVRVRQEIFKTFWDLKSHKSKWDFIAGLIKFVVPKRRAVATEDMVDSPFRQNNYEYYLYDLTPTNPILVCKQMFISTLAIGAKMVRTVINKLKTDGGKISPDKRGKNPKKTKLDPLLITGVTNHINRYPTVDSHYCRSTSGREYLDEKLSVAKMYRMYLKERNNLPFTATVQQYRYIFNSKFNLSFFKPKKDQCPECLRWKHSSSELEKANEDFAREHSKHLTDKEEIRRIIREDKAYSKENKATLRVCTYDLGKVLYCPKGENDDFFYKRKLSNYSFAIYDCTMEQGYAYVWNQTVGQRGSDEINSCIMIHVEAGCAEGIKEFHFYSDSCAGQNRNQFLFSALYMAVMKYEVTIIHRYFVEGHTHMEVDSMHAKVEQKIKDAEIFSPSQYVGLIRTDKVKSPEYVVKEMTQKDIVSFKPLAEFFQWKKIPIMKVKEIKFCCTMPGIVEYRTDYNANSIQVKIIPAEPGRPVNWSTLNLKPAYNGRISLKKELLDDLMWFVQKRHIPAHYHDFYNNLSAAPDTGGYNVDNVENEDIIDDAVQLEDNDQNPDDPMQVDNIIEHDRLHDVPNVSLLEEGWKIPEINDQRESAEPENHHEEVEEETNVPDSSNDDLFD